MHMIFKGVLMDDPFLKLKSIYASKEVGMEVLHMIESSDIAVFENRGISRRYKECLECVVRHKERDFKGNSFKVYVRI